MTESHDSLLLTTKEASEMAEVSQRTIQKWIRQGNLIAIQRVPVLLIARADLETFLYRRQLPVHTIPTMPKGQSFTLSDAARLCGVSRTTLQRAVRAGRLHLNTEHRLDQDELIRAGYLDSDTEPTGMAEVIDQPDQLVDKLSDQVTDLLAENRAMRTRLQRVEKELRALKSRKASAEHPRQQILAFMKSHPGPHHMREIQKGLGWEHTPRFTLRHLVNDGLLRRVRPGVYELLS